MPRSIKKWNIGSDRPDRPSQTRRGQNAKIAAARGGEKGVPGNIVCVILYMRTMDAIENVELTIEEVTRGSSRSLRARPCTHIPSGNQRGLPGELKKGA